MIEMKKPLRRELQRLADEEAMKIQAAMRAEALASSLRWCIVRDEPVSSETALLAKELNCDVDFLWKEGRK